jgi:hypothetical protein
MDGHGGGDEGGRSLPILNLSAANRGGLEARGRGRLADWKWNMAIRDWHTYIPGGGLLGWVDLK